MNSSPHVQSPVTRAEVTVTRRRSWFWSLLGLVVGGLFIYAGALKVWDPFAFVRDIQNYRILSYPLALRLALYLPWLEILCGLALIIGWLRSGAVAILTGLTMVFIGATIAAKARGLNIDCGCFGAASRGMSFTTHMVIDFAILAALLALWFRPASR